MSTATGAILTRRIGHDQVSALGFGAMGIGGIAYGPTEDDESRFKVLDKLVELGCTHWDTADIYGDSEVLLGRWFKRTGQRNEIFLATKFAFTPDHTICGTPEYAKESCNKSLEKLGVETIDLYYIHRIDPTVPIERTMGALKELIHEGKIRYIGLSEPSPATLRRAHKVHPISAIQVEYSPFVLDIEQKGHLLETARELGVTVVAYSPLGRGMLTGQFTSHHDLPPDDARRIIPKYSAENFPKIVSLVDQIKSIGQRYGATSGQVTLAWLLAQGEDLIPIPGTKKIKYAEENLGALKVQLAPEDVQAIRKAIDQTEIDGARCPPEYLATLYVDTPEPAE